MKNFLYVLAAACALVGCVRSDDILQDGSRRPNYNGSMDMGFAMRDESGIHVYLSDELRPEDPLTLRFSSGDSNCCHSISAASATEVPGAEEAVTDAITGRPLRHYYLRKTLPGPPDLGIVVVNADVRSSGEHVTVTTPSGDLDVMTCQSSEGIHLFANQMGRQVEHLYYALDYEVEPTCPRELFERSSDEVPK
jgi:hypothetical protein